MRILVTGGLGFIGMNFINYWLERYDDEIINLDKVTYASNRPEFIISATKNNYRFIKGDIKDKKIVNEIVADVDCIVNFAAESHVDNSISNSSEFVLTNVLGTQVILEATRRYDIRLHHISTDEVFGTLGLNSNDRFTEDSCYLPQNPYSASKASADHFVNAYVNTYGIKATISNCSNNFGPFQHAEKLIPKSIFRLIKGKKAQLYGDGKQIRDWIYVGDHCSAIDTILKKGRIGQNYLIGARNEMSNIDVIEKIVELLQSDLDSPIEFVKDRLGHDKRYAINPNKIMNDLGWKPLSSFDDALYKTISFYKANQKFYNIV